MDATHERIKAVRSKTSLNAITGKCYYRWFNMFLMSFYVSTYRHYFAFPERAGKVTPPLIYHCGSIVYSKNHSHYIPTYLCQHNACLAIDSLNRYCNRVYV